MSKLSKKLRELKKQRRSPVELDSRIKELSDAGPVRDQLRGIPVAQWAQRYRKIREASRRLNQMLVERIDKQGREFAAQHLGILHNGIFVLHDESEMLLVLEHAIYNYRPDGLNAVERLAKESPPAEGSDEAVWLAGAVRTFFSMFLVVDRVRGFGIQARDVLTGDALLIADINFSQSATLGLTLASRLLPMDDFYITSGTVLPMVDEQVLQAIGNYLHRTCFQVKDFRTLPRERALLLESFIIRACLASRSLQHVRWVDA